MKKKYTEEFIQQLISDYEEAAEELLVDLPEPGTDMAKLLHANIMMRKYTIPGQVEQIDNLKKLLKSFLPDWAKSPVPEGMAPMFYGTLTPEGDKKVQETLRKWMGKEYDDVYENCPKKKCCGKCKKE
jgi:hypothetical protein